MSNEPGCKGYCEQIRSMISRSTTHEERDVLERILQQHRKDKHQNNGGNRHLRAAQ